MNAEQLYAGMKRSIEAFGLSWHEKDKIEVTATDGGITFVYGGMSMSYTTGKYPPRVGNPPIPENPTPL